jgi:glycosyltransferase involved in cell wall biosynthesis
MTRMPSVVVTHPGSQQVYETVLGLQDAGMLRRFVASVYWTHDRPHQRLPYRFLPGGLRAAAVRGLRRRWHPGIDARFVREIPSPFLTMRGAAIALRAVGMRPLAGIERLGDAWFDQAASRWLARSHDITQVHAFEGEALHTFRAARRLGLRTVLDVPAAHEENLRLCELEARECGTPAYRRWGSRARISEERTLAHVIVSPSPSVTRCLTTHGVAASKIVEIPFGADPERFSPAARAPSRFRLLYVASINHRKGTRYLLEAWQRLSLADGELLLAGTPDEAGSAILRHYRGCYRTLGQVPWFDLPDLFRSASAFVLPSLAEGSALVTYMAMASGLPVIVTDDSGSVARDGVEGLVIPSRDVEGLMRAIRRLYEHRDEAAAMGAAGRVLIEHRYTWKHYHARVAALHRALRAGEDIADAVANVSEPAEARAWR